MRQALPNPVLAEESGTTRWGTPTGRWRLCQAGAREVQVKVGRIGGGVLAIKLAKPSAQDRRACHSAPMTTSTPPAETEPRCHEAERQSSTRWWPTVDGPVDPRDRQTPRERAHHARWWGRETRFEPGPGDE